jgi:hypothetical protein
MAASTTKVTTRGWVRDVVVGVLVGGIVSAIVAVNVIIYAGIEPGYEAGLADVFRQNVLVGLLVVAVLCAGPVLGVVTARGRRRRRRAADPDTPGETASRSARARGDAGQAAP